MLCVEQECLPGGRSREGSVCEARGSGPLAAALRDGWVPGAGNGPASHPLPDEEELLLQEQAAEEVAPEGGPAAATAAAAAAAGIRLQLSPLQLPHLRALPGARPSLQALEDPARTTAMWMTQLEPPPRWCGAKTVCACSPAAAR